MFSRHNRSYMEKIRMQLARHGFKLSYRRDINGDYYCMVYTKNGKIPCLGVSNHLYEATVKDVETFLETL